MSFLTPAKKSLVAVAMVLPMTLVACGNDEEANNAQGGDKTTATKTTQASKDADKSAAPSKEKKSEDKDANKDK